MKRSLLLFLIVFPFLTFGQEYQPKVGLVLSGGGAKGFAHIGVLKEIEKAGLQIDYIGGTSMGAIVGGLYAAGYSANQIEEIIVKTDFLALLQDKNHRKTHPFFEKEYGEKHFITLPVSEAKIGLPQAVSKGQNVLNLFSYLLAPIYKIDDFSKLSIPFFCIATDVETGDEILLEAGSLPLALRASGSFPTLLTPVEVGGKLLIDGGVSNNFPVDVMKQKGVDLIIGVDVQGRLNKRKDLKSAIDILNQVVNYKMYKKAATQMSSIDVYIHPETFNYSIIDFQEGVKILNKGEEAAAKKKEIFARIAAKQLNKKEKIPIEIVDRKFFLNKIEVSGNYKYTHAYILGKLNIKEGDSLSHKIITNKIPYLSATNNFDRVDYRVVRGENKNTLILTVKESNQRANVKLGIHYDYLYKSGVLVNYNHKKLFNKNDVFSLDLILGDNLRYDLIYFVDNGFYTSYGFKSRYNHFQSNAPFNTAAMSALNDVNLTYSDITNEVFVQTTFDRKFAVGFSAEFKRIEVTTESAQDENNNSVKTFEKSDYASAYAYLKLDTYDKKYFATRGLFADISFRWSFWSSDFKNNFKNFSQLKGKVGFATSFWETLTFEYISEGGLSFNNPSSNVFDFYLGGNNKNFINTFVPFYGYEFGALANKSFLKSEFNLRYQFYPKNYFLFIANFARLEDNVFKDIDIFSNIKSGYAIGYSLDTFVGPIELKYAWSPDTNENYLLFNLGYWF